MRFVVRLATDEDLVISEDVEIVPLFLDTAIQASRLEVYQEDQEDIDDGLRYWWVGFGFSQSLEKQLKQKGKKVWVQWNKMFLCIWEVVPIE